MHALPRERAVLQVLKHPNPILKQACSPVTAFDDGLKALVDQMAEAMYAAHGVGLAAPQVGATVCLVLTDPSAGEAANELQALVNPRVTWRSPEAEAREEGCLSLPGVTLCVVRSLAVDVEYSDLVGTLHLVRCTGLRARIVQHELDHLSGVLALDRVGKVARKLALKRLPKNRVTDGADES